MLKNSSLLSRRDHLRMMAGGFGYVAFSAIASTAAGGSPTAPKKPHFPARAKRVIMIFLQGGMSHLDTFDYKPRLQKDDGQPIATDSPAKILGSPWKFAQHGESGQWVSELLPHTASHADDLCVLTGMHTDQQAHGQAVPFFHTGHATQARPSMGAWTLYGLGTENDDLPGYIATNPLPQFGQNHGSAFLPATYQATILHPQADPPLANLACKHLTSAEQRQQLDILRSLNERRLRSDGINGELEAVIHTYEMAFRMQSAVPALLDFSNEDKQTLEMYGLNSGSRRRQEFARQCLMARRFAEQGVRFIEIGSGGWDHHEDIKGNLPQSAETIDQPISALLTDLKQRGLLKDTLVVCAGEFGRTPAAQFGTGRDHNIRGFTIWMAGGGVKAGYRHGMTDEYGREAIGGRVHIHDLHATMLHLLGLDHETLTFRYSGRDFRLTDVHGKVVKEILS